MHLPRLNKANLPLLPESVRPRYPLDKRKTGIVHLGIGAFHRAHMAAYTDDVLASGDMGWAIAGVSLRSPDVRNALAPQDALYTLSVSSTQGESLQIIGSIADVLVAPEDPEALIARMSSAGTAIVSLTITEKGYCHHPATGRLDREHPDVLHDLANPDKPRSALGFLAAAIARRRSAGIPPFTILCCDNLPANGATLHRILTEFAALQSHDLASFIETEIACPNSMVDRIVPATTADDRSRISQALSLQDEAPVVTEAFSQWVIEDRFSMGRPAWDRFGVLFVEDVAPFELMKLRLLNGSHSSLSYLGYLLGHQTVAEAIADADIARFVARLMRDSAKTLTMPESIDLASYQAQLIARFANTALRHRTWQIAMDGSQKLPQRLLGSIRDLMDAGCGFDAHALGVAAWIRYIYGTDEKGQPIDVRDPLRPTFEQIRSETSDSGDFIDAILDIAAVFGDLRDNELFRKTISTAARGLFAVGARATLRNF